MFSMRCFVDSAVRNSFTTNAKFGFPTLPETYTYMVCAKLEYRAFSNSSDWPFLKREIDQDGKDTYCMCLNGLTGKNGTTSMGDRCMQASEELTLAI